MQLATATPVPLSGGKPAGPVRMALVQALRNGAYGTYDVLAQSLGLPERDVSRTLWELRREGLADVRTHSKAHGRRRGRPRVVYGPRAANDSPFSAPLDALRFAGQVWR